MNRSDVQALIQQIEAFSGTTWPATAADAWLTLLVNVDAADAWQAVSEWFNQPEPPTTRIHPGYVVRRAASIRDVRLRKERRALPAGHISETGPPVPPNAAARRLRAELIRRYGDQSGRLGRRVRAA